MTQSLFDQSFFTFYEALGDNNERVWFQENKDWYTEAVLEPARALVLAMKPRLEKISKHIVADPSGRGGSIFRIHRDTRFSKDKTPYKTHLAIQFRHSHGKDVHAPGYFVQMSPREFFVGTGIWRPDSPSLLKIRQSISDDPIAWNKVRDNKKFLGHFEHRGDTLKRPPKGFDPDHPNIEDLKRKDFIGISDYPPPFVLSPDLVDELDKCFQSGAPLMKWLCKSLRLPF